MFKILIKKLFGRHSYSEPRCSSMDGKWTETNVLITIEQRLYFCTNITFKIYRLGTLCKLHVSVRRGVYIYNKHSVNGYNLVNSEEVTNQANSFLIYEKITTYLRQSQH